MDICSGVSSFFSMGRVEIGMAPNGKACGSSAHQAGLPQADVSPRRLPFFSRVSLELDANRVLAEELRACGFDVTVNPDPHDHNGWAESITVDARPRHSGGSHTE